jgi:hypothetical protein
VPFKTLSPQKEVAPVVVMQVAEQTTQLAAP